MKNNNTKGFTLIEILLLVGVVGLAIVGIYIIFNSASSSLKSSEEAKNLNGAINRLNSAVRTNGTYAGFNKDTLDKLGGQFVSNFNLTSINSPSPDKLNINYTGISNSNCSKFITKMLDSSDRISAIINGTEVTGVDSLENTVDLCKSTLNTVTVVLNNYNVSFAGLNPVVPTPPPPPPPPPPPVPVLGRWVLYQYIDQVADAAPAGWVVSGPGYEACVGCDMSTPTYALPGSWNRKGYGYSMTNTITGYGGMVAFVGEDYYFVPM